MKLRSILLCLLTLAIASAGMASFIAHAKNDQLFTAQDNLAAAKSSAREDAFVLARNAQGQATCRVATAAERHSIMQRRGDSYVIYAGAPRGDAALQKKSGITVNGSVPSTPLLPSAGLHIILHGTAQFNQAENQTAKNAFIVAANRWEALIATPITVVLDVDFGASFFGDDFNDPNILGATGTAEDTRPYSEVRARLLANSPSAAETQLYNALPAASIPTQLGAGNFNSLTIRMSLPNSRALGFVPDISNPDALPIGAGDAGIGFNSAFPFDFDPTNGIDATKVDFDSVATHEIGHALGFLSESGGAVYAPTTIWDLLRFRSGAANLGTLATAPRIMTAGGTQVYFNGQTNTFGSQELRLSTGGPGGTAAGGDGNQSSHWKADELIGRDQYIGLMDPTIGDGERDPITDNDIKAIDSFGYAIGSPVAAPPSPPAGPGLPSNDNFANATVVQNLTGSILGNSAGATKEVGEPLMLASPAGAAGGKSIWYRWTSPVNGTAIFDTEGSGFDTLLAVSTGNAVGGLTRVVAANDDLAPGQTTASRVTFPVTAGVTYQLTVDGFDNGGGTETGLLELNWSASGSTPTPTPTPTPIPSPTPPIATTAVGRIVENGNPLAGALVGLSQNGVVLSQMTTGADGNFAVGGAFVGNVYNVLVVKSGYSFSSPHLNFLADQAPQQQVGDVLATAGNPIDGSSFFVTKHYDDFLARTADAGGLAFWSNNIESCLFDLQCREVKRIDTSAAFFLSIEFQETGYLVYRAYKAAYGDAFDATIGSPPGYPVPIIRRAEFLADSPLISQGVVVGVGNWQAQLEANKQSFMLDFVNRSRFTTAYPATMTADQFVTKLDQSAGGVLSAGEKTQQVALLGATPADAAKRAQVLRAVAEDADLNLHEQNRAFVLMQYFGYLRRDPNSGNDTNYGGYKFWLDKLNSFNGDFRGAEMVKAFITSGEYRGRFGN